VVQATRGREEEARAALDEAVSLYDGLQARWDIRRAEARLRPHGIRRDGRGPRAPRAARRFWLGRADPWVPRNSPPLESRHAG
jgi:hypothetical protein